MKVILVDRPRLWGGLLRLIFGVKHVREKNYIE